MEDFSDVMVALRGARALAGLRQVQLAERAGVSRQMIARIEHEDQAISVRTLAKVRYALEKAGIVFLPETGEVGLAIARKKMRARRPRQ